MLLFVLLCGKITFDHFVPRAEVAGDTGLIASFAGQRPVVQTAARDLDLRDRAIRQDRNGLGAALTGAFDAVGLAVVEDVPLSVHFHEATMGVACVVEGFCVALVPDIRYADERAAIVEIPIRVIADGVAELVAEDRGIDEVVFPVDLPDGAGLEKAVALEVCPSCRCRSGYDGFPLSPDRFHIRLQLQTDGLLDPVAAELENQLERALRRKTHVEISLAVVVHQHAGIEGEGISFLLAIWRSVGILYAAVIRKGADGAVRHGDAGAGQNVELIVQIITPVRALYAVRRVHMHLPVLVAGILRSSIDHALIAPVAQIVQRSRPADVIVHAEVLTAKAVVAAVDIEPFSEHAGFSVRDVLIAWQIGIKSRMLVHQSSLLFSKTRQSCFSISGPHQSR